MAKQGQHNDDAHDYDKSKGHNNPSKSVDITTGTPKKQETYREEAVQHQATNRRPQPARNDWNQDTRNKPSIENSPRARDSDISGERSGSQSNESKSSQGH